jgi:hypothetical protein
MSGLAAEALLEDENHLGQGAARRASSRTDLEGT